MQGRAAHQLRDGFSLGCRQLLRGEALPAKYLHFLLLLVSFSQLKVIRPLQCAIFCT